MASYSCLRKWLRGRASPCQGEGRGFESRLPLHVFHTLGMWRSLVARYLGEVEVPGSNPGIPTIGGYSSEGEHHLDTVGVIGSIPINRTIWRDVRVGRRSTIGNRVGAHRVSRVRIPFSPPSEWRRSSAGKSTRFIPVVSVVRVHSPLPTAPCHLGSGVERLTRNEQVVGSNPTGGSSASVAQ